MSVLVIIASTCSNTRGLTTWLFTSRLRAANSASNADRYGRELYPEYEYLAQLYYKAGAIEQIKRPTFFCEVMFSGDTSDIFRMVLLPGT